MSRRALSLHHLAMQELSPVELVRVAADAGFEHVCIFVRDPGNGQPVAFPLVTPANKLEMRRALDDTGVSIYNLETFFLAPDTDVEDFRAQIEMGAELGAQRATAFVVDEDDARSTDNFARFCELTRQFGIKAGTEFMAFLHVRTLDHAMRIVRGANHPNGTLAIDSLHLMRNGTSPADLAKIGREEIGYVQICDGPLAAPADPFYEAVHNRMAPGEGEFPLFDFLDCLKPDSILSLEVPMDARRDAGMVAVERARLLNRATRTLLERHEGQRASR